MSHKKYSVTLSWHAACIAAEQEWDCKWVVVQLEEGQRGRVEGWGSRVEREVGMGQPPIKVGPLWGGQRERVPAACDKSKWRASSSPEVEPSKWAWREQVMAGSLDPMVYFLISGALVKQSAGGS
ncbi:hypothetical protein C0989_002185 [Termitomyces sp. Mn162]|nr:hypothetical protein C0989_002185 [Termitomyces sp. Mn162]